MNTPLSQQLVPELQSNPALQGLEPFESYHARAPYLKDLTQK